MHSQLAVAGVIVCIVFPFLASLILFLRLYAQNVKAKGLRADDYFITAGNHAGPLRHDNIWGF